MNHKLHKMIKDYIGKGCEIHTLDHYVVGVITSIKDNWIEVKTSTYKGKRIELVNMDYIEKVTINE